MSGLSFAGVYLPFAGYSGSTQGRAARPDLLTPRAGW